MPYGQYFYGVNDKEHISIIFYIIINSSQFNTIFRKMASFQIGTFTYKLKRFYARTEISQWRITMAYKTKVDVSFPSFPLEKALN